MSDRLFPALSFDAAHVASGNTDIVRDGVLIAPDGGGPQFLGELVIFGLHSAEGLMYWDPPTGVHRITSGTGVGGNEIATAVNGTAFAVARRDPPRIIFSDGQVLAGFVSPAFSDDGRHFACLRHEDGSLWLRPAGGALMPVLLGGNIITGCSLPRFGGTTLMVEIGQGRVLGIADCNNPATIADPDVFDFPGIPLLKPHPVWVEGLGALVYSCHTDDALILLLWGSRFGWIITRGEIDQGFHDARPRPEGDVRIVWTRKGALEEALQALIDPIDVIDTLAAPVPEPDVPFIIAPGGQPFNAEAMLRKSCTAEQDGVLWFRKGDPFNGDAWGAWLDYDGTNVGLLADSSTGQVTRGGRVKAMWLEGTRLWMPLKGRSGWSASYDCDFVWVDGTRTREHVLVAVHAGRGVYKGIEVTLRHTYDPRRADPKNPRRHTGFLEYSYYNADGEVRWEEWQDDPNGVPQLVRVTQPVPSTGKEAFVPPPRPQPYGPIVPSPPKPPEPHTMTAQELAHLLKTYPPDIFVDHYRAYQAQLLEQDKNGNEGMSAGAAMIFFPQFYGTSADLLVQRGNPSGSPAQVAAGWNSIADAAGAAAVTEYRKVTGQDPR